MKLHCPVRIWACKGGWFFAILLVSVILTALSMGKMVSAQTELESPGSVLFDKTTDTIESYSDIPYTDDLNSSSFISYIYSTNDVVPKKENEIESLRTPNSYVYLNEENKKTYVIYPSEQFVLKNDGQWYQLEYGTSTIDKFYEEIYFEKPITKWIIKSANAQTYSGSGDGYVWAGNVNWATVKGYTSGTAEYTNTEVPTGSYLTGGTYYISRMFLPFDTSTIDDDQCVDTAVMTLNCFYVGGTGDTTHVFEGTQAATNELVANDYDNLELGTSFGNLAISTTGDKDITLNADGEALIDVQGWTKYAITDADDMNNNTPGGGNYVSFRPSEQTGTGDDPYLTITTQDCPASTTPVTESTSTPFSVEGLNYSWDLTIIAGLTEHYESTTTAPDWVEVSYYHIPFLAWLILFLLLVLIFSRVIIELLIRWRTK